MQGVFFVAACASVLAVALICIFLFANGIPAIKEIGFVKFITGEMWRPSNELFGIFPMIIGSLYVTAGAVIIGVPIGILTSVFMAMYCPKKIYRPLKAATELLAGIPSVVYGFFGLVVVVPIIRDFGRALKDAGAIFRIPFIYTDDLKGTIDELKREGITVYAAHLKGENSYDMEDYKTACAFLIGNEGNGLTEETAACADRKILIPMEGGAESLNAAVASAVLMFEAGRQRRNKRK